MALFGEKYGDEVRVIKMGEFSTELCGGTHASRTGDIGPFKIVSEMGVAAGVRRIEALTGAEAFHHIQAQDALLKEVAHRLKAQQGDEILTRISALQAELKSQDKELSLLKRQQMANAGDALIVQAIVIDGVKILAVELPGADNNALREALDRLKTRLKTAAIVLASCNEGKVTLVAGVTKDLTDKIKAGDLVNSVAQQVGGKGGGRPDMAQAGGSEPEHLAQALASVKDWVSARL